MRKNVEAILSVAVLAVVTVILLFFILPPLICWAVCR
jgi:hypothetical protein